MGTCRPRTFGRYACRDPLPFASAIIILRVVIPVSEDLLGQLQADNARLRGLVDFGRQITAERDLRAQLRLLCTELARTNQCSAAIVVLTDASHGIESVETVGLDDDRTDMARAALADGPLAHVLTARELTRFDDAGPLGWPSRRVI